MDWFRVPVAKRLLAKLPWREDALWEGEELSAQKGIVLMQAKSGEPWRLFVFSIVQLDNLLATKSSTYHSSSSSW
jgi:hypothetical protein